MLRRRQHCLWAKPCFCMHLVRFLKSSIECAACGIPKSSPSYYTATKLSTGIFDPLHLQVNTPAVVSKLARQPAVSLLLKKAGKQQR